MITHPTTHKNKISEVNTLKEILLKNHYRQHITSTIQNHHISPKNSKTTKGKWATFTYYGLETRMITNPFRNANIGIGFKIHNTIKTI
jgi:hypothetical protein